MSLLPSGGAIIKVTSTQWETVGSLIYPGVQIAAKGQEAKKAWITAQAGDTSVGLDLVLEDNMGTVIAGPATSYGGSVQQLMGLMPLRVSRLRTSGQPQVLVLRARNRSSKSPPSLVGQLSLELGTISEESK